MKIIVGTPRSGTSFVANWYANEFPDYTYMLSNKLGEYFHPDFFKTADTDRETLKRLTNLPKYCIFKLHTGKEMSKHIWDFVYQHPVILVKRKDLLGQFISYGIGYTTEKWVNFNANNRNGLTQGQTFVYKQQWFDELAQRLHELKQREPQLTVERTVWFEDINNFSVNGVLPRRQNSEPNQQKLQLIDNQPEFMHWFQKFESEYNNV